MINAPRMPQKRTVCCHAGGTAKYEKISGNTKMLSPLSEYSINQPVEDSNPFAWPAKCHTPAPKRKARVIHVAVQPSASVNDIACALRWNTPKSSASIPRINKAKPTHSQTETIMPLVPSLDVPGQPWPTLF